MTTATIEQPEKLTSVQLWSTEIEAAEKELKKFHERGSISSTPTRTSLSLLCMPNYRSQLYQGNILITTMMWPESLPWSSSVVSPKIWTIRQIISMQPSDIVSRTGLYPDSLPRGSVSRRIPKTFRSRPPQAMMRVKNR